MPVEALSGFLQDSGGEGVLIISFGWYGDFGQKREISGAKRSYRELLNQAPKFALQESLPLLQLSFLVLQLLQPPVLAELTADESEIEIPVGVAQPTALAQQSPIEGQDSLPGPRCHGGRMRGRAT